MDTFDRIICGLEKSMSKKKKYSSEFKKEAVRLVLESGRSVTSVAEELGVSQPALSRWGRAEEAADKSELADQRAEVLRLQRQLKEVTQERDFLRDAAAYFAKPKA